MSRRHSDRRQHIPAFAVGVIIALGRGEILGQGGIGKQACIVPSGDALLAGNQRLSLPVNRRIRIERSIGPIDSGQRGLQRVVVAPAESDRTCDCGTAAQCTVVLVKVDMRLVIMSSRSSTWASFLSIVSSTMHISELSSQEPAARKPKATVAWGSSGYRTSPATCSQTKRAVGLVFIERADQIVAIRPRIRARAILIVAVRLRKVGHVHPMPRPTLAIARTGEQPIDLALVPARAGVRYIGRHLFRRRRQAGQVDRQAAQ